MEPLEDQPRHDGRRRVDSAVMWTATAGALACSVVIFLATNWPSPDPVAEPMPTEDWKLPVTTTVGTGTPSATFEAVAPPPASSAASSPTATSPTRKVDATAVAPPPAPPTNAATTPQPAGSPLHAVGAGKCLDVPTSPATADAQLQISDCNGQANQAWTRTPSGQLTVTLDGTTRCLDAYGQETKPGTKVLAWPCNGQANERWRVNRDGSITGVQSGLCLDVSGWSSDNGALVQLWDCNGQLNQQWTLG